MGDGVTTITNICGACGGKNGEHHAWCNMPRACLVEPYPFGMHPWQFQPAAPAPMFVPLPLPLPSPPLSDADVERIARRAAEIVVELLAAREPTP